MDRLIKALHSTNKNLRIRVAWCLAGSQNENAIQELLKILKDENEDPDVRIAVINTLSQYDNQMFDSELFVASKSNKPKVKAAALLALAGFIRREINELYIAGLYNSDEVVRKSAVESMGILALLQRDDLLEQRFGNKNETENIRLAAIDSLKQIKSKSSPNLFRETLKDKTESIKIRSAAVQALGEAKDIQSLNLLMDIAKDKKEAVELRKAAITGLGVMGSSKATKLLIDFLDSPDAILRHEAVKSLELLADPRGLKPLMMVLMNRNENDSIRNSAGMGIIKIDPKIAFGPLVQILKDETEISPARRIAAEVLASSGNPQSVSVFTEVIKNKQQPWWLRRIAVNCIAQLESCKSATSTCTEALKVAISDPDERVVNAARVALANNPKLLSKNQ
jgi:HEAT repeat protein